MNLSSPFSLGFEEVPLLPSYMEHLVIGKKNQISNIQVRKNFSAVINGSFCYTLNLDEEETTPTTPCN